MRQKAIANERKTHLKPGSTPEEIIDSINLRRRAFLETQPQANLDSELRLVGKKTSATAAVAANKVVHGSAFLASGGSSLPLSLLSLPYTTMKTYEGIKQGADSYGAPALTWTGVGGRRGDFTDRVVESRFHAPPDKMISPDLLQRFNSKNPEQAISKYNENTRRKPRLDSPYRQFYSAEGFK